MNLIPTKLLTTFQLLGLLLVVVLKKSLTLVMITDHKVSFKNVASTYISNILSLIVVFALTIHLSAETRGYLRDPGLLAFQHNVHFIYAFENGHWCVAMYDHFCLSTSCSEADKQSQCPSSISKMCSLTSLFHQRYPCTFMNLQEYRSW